MKIVYFSNVLGLRDIPDLSMCSDDNEFNQSVNELISAFWLEGATMTICQTDGEIIQWLDVVDGVLVNDETVIKVSGGYQRVFSDLLLSPCRFPRVDTSPHFATISA